MKYSEITLEDKNWETLDLIHNFSKSVIKDFDEVFKKEKPLPIETPFIDLQVESYFSIQAFCVLMKEGLVSSACAILRIIIEQASIVSLLTKHEKARDLFYKIRQEKIKYRLATAEERKEIKKELALTKRININKVSQYFDYGWYKEAGCSSMTMKSICETAGLSRIYETVDTFLNQFSHGQISIYQFRRARNNVDKKFIKQIFQEFFQLFSTHTQSMILLHGFEMFSLENRRVFKLINALCFDIRTRISEENLNIAFEQGKISAKDLKQFIEVKNSAIYLLDKATDDREKYFLSQAFIRMTRQALLTHIYLQTENVPAEGFKVNNILDLFNKLNFKIEGYQRNDLIPLDTLLRMIDSFDDNHAFNDSFIDYSFVYSVNTLLEIIRKHYKS